MTEQEIEQIKSEHPLSYKGILHSYDWNEIKTSRPFQISTFASISFLIISLLSQKTSLEIVIFWSSQIIAIFPNLLGFNLGGYALVIGFGNTELIESMTKIGIGKKTSPFQKVSGIFASAILLQLLTFATAFIVNFFVQLQFSSTNPKIVNSVNSSISLVLSFLGIWGILILFSLVANVFSWGQGHHLKLTLQRKLKEQNNK